MLIFRLFAVLAAIVINGCAGTPEKQQEPATPAPSGVSIKKELPKRSETKTEIDQDVLFMLMSAEIAGQRGQYELAYEGYLEAAKRVKDPKPAERAAMIAMYLKDAKKLKKSLALWLKKEPQNPTVRKLAVLASLKEGVPQKTQAHLAAMFASDPAGFEASVMELAAALQSEGKLSALYAALEDFAVKKPGQAAIYYLQAVIAQQMKNEALAEKKVAQALKHQPDWDKALIFQAQLAVLAGDMPKAVDYLRGVHQRYPDNQKVSKTLTQLLLKSGNYEEAGKIYQQSVDKDPKDFESWLALALVNIQADRDDDAERILKKLLDEDEWREQARFYFGKLEEKRENVKKALKWYDQVKAEPFAFEAGIASVNLLVQDKQFEDALTRLQAMRSNYPKERLRITVMTAELFNQQKRYQDAFDLLTDALVEMSDSTELLYTRSLVAERLGKYDVLEADLKKILASNPDHAQALNALGYTLLEFPSRLAEAEKYLSRALTLQPDEPVIMDSYGWLLFKQGHADKALGYLEKAYARQKENEIAAHLSEVLWSLGRREEAAGVFDKAFKSAPEDEYLLDFKQRILNRAE